MVAPYESMELLSLEVTFAQNLSPLFRGRAAPTRRLHQFENAHVVEDRLGRPGISIHNPGTLENLEKLWRWLEKLWRSLELWRMAQSYAREFSLVKNFCLPGMS